jgi:antitoxin (DNA-binding transcriptional repressor) of toxin-antitoxin stability system
MQQIELDQVGQQLAQLIERALAGEEVVITQADQPVLKLVRVAASTPRRKRGSAKGQIQIAPDFDAPLDDV